MRSVGCGRNERDKEGGREGEGGKGEGGREREKERERERERDEGRVIEIFLALVGKG